MNAEILIAVVLVAAVVWLLTHLFPARHQPKLGEAHGRRVVAEGAPLGTHEERPYQAVSVRPEATCCPAARSIQGARFLVDEAPMIPLPDCSRPRCHCVYAHHSDRRTGTRTRRSAAGIQYERNNERRVNGGRRTIDLAPA